MTRLDGRRAGIAPRACTSESAVLSAAVTLLCVGLFGLVALIAAIVNGCL